MKKVGIPRALLYYKYYPFWKTFLEELGCEAVTSGKTTKKTLQDGAKCTIDETCLSVKVFCGHVLDLMEKGVDYLFIPRIQSVEKKCFVCTKFLGLYDIVRNCIPHLSDGAILTPNIDFARRTLYQSMFTVGWRLKRNPLRVHTAYLRAKKKQQSFEKRVSLSKTPQGVIQLMETDRFAETERKGSLNIALIGHPYNVYDDFVNMKTIGKLEAMGVNVLTHEMVAKEESHRIAHQVSNDIYWSYQKEMLGASFYFSRRGIDGIIFIVSFPCGPDSLVVEYANMHLKGKVPILSLVLDEHQGEAGIATRLESFTDLIRIKKKK